jgi:hypothetical protein
VRCRSGASCRHGSEFADHVALIDERWMPAAARKIGG